MNNTAGETDKPSGPGSGDATAYCTVKHLPPSLLDSLQSTDMAALLMDSDGVYPAHVERSTNGR